MQEPLLFGTPLTLAFLYFVWYSVLGWAMETTYCSIGQKHFVNRGFLHGPFCPIYGVGALLMVLGLSHFMGNIPLFLAASIVTMSAWEYFVGWVLETTTHIKYWDYSNEKYNLKGRICLRNSLIWGLVSYVALYWIHPQTVRLFSGLSSTARWVLTGVLAAVLLTDTVTTIRSLALTTMFLNRAEATRLEMEAKRKELRQLSQQRAEELRQVSQQRAEELRQVSQQRAEELRQVSQQRTEELRQTSQQKVEELALQTALLKLELQQKNLLEEAAHHSRRFFRHYNSMTSTAYRRSLQRIRQSGEQFREYRAQRMKELKQKNQTRKDD
ncbi:MAG: hypothetical protein LUE89_04880 [Clostridiales bacterium]|nr:hypothetical protein [Clostridiales bacterium]